MTSLAEGRSSSAAIELAAGVRGLAAAVAEDRAPRSDDEPARKLARIHGVWGIAQLARRGRAKEGAQHAALLTPLLTDPDAEIRAQAAKMIGDIPYAQAAPSLVPLLADSAPRASGTGALPSAAAGSVVI